MNFNEYYIDNISNENQLNAKKARSTVHQLKQLIKSFLRKKKSSTYKKEDEPDFFGDNASEIDDNLANELLEARIFEEIDNCNEFSAVPVYENGKMEILPIARGQKYVPVNFARTEAGTFFWTSMHNGADCDISTYGDYNAISRGQMAQIQVPQDRWAQA
ncbi:enhancer of split malpha protein-like [Onthophagus taurus]|uniref:enhancer of split malpha protein-like n=1 Tax=Onthophagus taurus TaxID=166361 RepID=UPI000C1FFBAA|nr:enhancer of split malpha protein-like [Onthophagus taurus]